MEGNSQGISTPTESTLEQARWELVNRLAGKAQAPQLVLDMVLKSIINQLASFTNDCSCVTSLQTRVIEKIKEESLKRLKHCFLLSVCHKIFRNFSKSDIEKILEEHKKNNKISSQEYSCYIISANKIFQDEINYSLIEVTRSMIPSLARNLIEALQQEGIHFFTKKTLILPLRT